MIRPETGLKRELVIDVLRREGLPTRIDIGRRKLGLSEQNAYNNIPFAMTIFDDKGVLIFSNRAMRRLDPTVAIGLIDAITAPNNDSAGNKTPSLLETSRSDTGIDPVEINLGDRWYQMTFSPELGQNEQPTGRTLVITTDLTEKKLQEAEIARVQQEARETAAAFAHDLKNPLSVIKGLAQIIQYQATPTLSQETQTRLGTIATTVDRITNLINRSVDYAIAGSELKLEPLAMTKILQDVYGESQIQMGQAKVTGKISLPLADLMINGDYNKLAIALRILVSNAFQAAEGQTIKEVAFVAGAENRDAIVYIADTGTGVPQGEEESIFEGKTTKRGTKQHGTGFGLRTARKISRRLGGDVYLVHTVNAQTLHEHPEYKHTGSIFALRIPLS